MEFLYIQFLHYLKCWVLIWTLENAFHTTQVLLLVKTTWVRVIILLFYLKMYQLTRCMHVIYIDTGVKDVSYLSSGAQQNKVTMTTLPIRPFQSFEFYVRHQSACVLSDFNWPSRLSLLWCASCGRELSGYIWVYITLRLVSGPPDTGPKLSFQDICVGQGPPCCWDNTFTWQYLFSITAVVICLLRKLSDRIQMQS